MLLRNSPSEGMRRSAGLAPRRGCAISSELPDIRARIPQWNLVGILAQSVREAVGIPDARTLRPAAAKGSERRRQALDLPIVLGVPPALRWPPSRPPQWRRARP